MVPARRIRSKVIVVNADTYSMSPINQDATHNDFDSFALPTTGINEPRFRPSDLVPWADPYIAGLIEQLQDEVREEQAETTWGRPQVSTNPAADLEWTWDESGNDYDPADRESPFELPGEVPAEGPRFTVEDFS